MLALCSHTWGKEPENPEKTTDLRRATNTLPHVDTGIRSWVAAVANECDSVVYITRRVNQIEISSELQFYIIGSFFSYFDPISMHDFFGLTASLTFDYRQYHSVGAEVYSD